MRWDDDDDDAAGNGDDGTTAITLTREYDIQIIYKVCTKYMNSCIVYNVYMYICVYAFDYIQYIRSVFFFFIFLFTLFIYTCTHTLKTLEFSLNKPTNHKYIYTAMGYIHMYLYIYYK